MEHPSNSQTTAMVLDAAKTTLDSGQTREGSGAALQCRAGFAPLTASPVHV
jgi:hypothetical protein